MADGMRQKNSNSADAGTARLPENEAERLKALQDYNVLDTPQENDFDDLVHLAAQICNAPISLVSLVDKDRQWFKGRHGLDLSETPRRLSFCSHTILEAPQMMVIPDTKEDPRFATNELVTAGPKIRSYAGAPLVTEEGYALGTLCVIDTKPREYTVEQKNALRVLSRQVMMQLELRKRLVEMARISRELETIHETQRQQLEALVRERTSELAEANAKLHDREAQLNGLINSALDAIICTDSEQRIILFNPAAENLFGYRAEELQGKHVSQLAPRLFRDIAAGASRGQPGFDLPGRVGVIEALRKNGEEFLAETSISEFKCNDKQLFTIIVRDITERTRNEEHAQRWQRVFELADFGLAIANCRDNTFVAVNHSFARQRGYEPDEMRGMSVRTVYPPGLQDEILVKFQEIDRSGHGLFESMHQRKDGSRFPVMVEGTTIKDSQGNPVSRVTYAVDVTDVVAAREALARSRAELERLVRERTAQLEEANDNLRNFSHTAAHDLRAPLRAINAYSAILLESYGLQMDSSGRDMLERVSRSATQMLAMLDDLLAYSKVSQTDLTLERVSLSFAVREVLRLSEREVQLKQAEVNVEMPLPEILGHPATVILLISNFVSNALKFVEPSMRPSIRIWAETTDSSVRLNVADNGIGIADENIPKLFGPFQRLHTDHAYPGTGLGLAIVKKAAERMGGRIGVESQLGRGSRFWVEFKKP